MLQFSGYYQMATLKKGLDYLIRFMEDRDILQALEIDREAFPNQWPHPTYSSLKQELRNKLAHYIVAHNRNEFIREATPEVNETNTFWGKFKKLFSEQADDRGQILSPLLTECVIGMAGCWLMAGEEHVTTIAVRDSYRHQGVGEGLLISLIDLGFEFKAQVVTLEVRVSNDLARSLYQKYGFNTAGIRRHYYTDNGEDAYIMTTDTIASPGFQSHFSELKRAYREKFGLLEDVS
jgi:ribosomal-protein-alanine N-acetyltransferase